MRHYASAPSIEKLVTGLAGFDFISHGGLPRGRATLVAGTTGSGKTVFATQFLIEGARLGEGGVFVTFEESPEEIRRNVKGLGWDIEKWEKAGRWSFVDVSPQVDEENVIVGAFDLSALSARIENAVRKTKATRIAIDSIGALFTQLEESVRLRQELHKLLVFLKSIGLTVVITAERNAEYGPISRHGVEEFVTDNVVIFRNELSEEVRRRTVEILKFRGTYHQKGEFPFTILPDHGLVIVPLSAITLDQKSSLERISSGNHDIDQMCAGGYFRDSITLVSGATGTGKTLMVTEFLAASIAQGERALLFGFEESREQIFRNAASFGHDFEKNERDGLLKIVCVYPESMGLEDHLIAMKTDIDQFKPRRIGVDSLSALERIASLRSFREFMIGLTAFAKQERIAGIFTSATTALIGGTSITEAHISTITDAIVLLRYAEIHGEMKRGLTILKMRGSQHDKDIREFTITSKGIVVGRAFRNVSGIISGTPFSQLVNEMDQLGGLFRDEEFRRPQRDA